MPKGFFEGVWFLLVKYHSFFIEGVITTLTISLLGTIFGFIIGMGLSMLRMSKTNKKDGVFKKIILKISSIFGLSYIQFFRGTPMMVQSVLIFYGFIALGGRWTAFVAGIVVVSLNTGAYMAEIIRSGINGIDPGQMEAARSLGMSSTKAMIHVILPQAIKNVIPAIGNEFVVNVKDTAVLSVITVSDLFFKSSKITATYYRHFEIYFITSIIYLIITLISSKLLSILDKKLSGRSQYSLPKSVTVPEAFIGGGKK